MFSRRLGKFIRQTPEHTVPKPETEKSADPAFEKSDIPQLESVVLELENIMSFLRTEIQPYIAETANRTTEDTKGWQKILSEQWKKSKVNFGDLPESFTQKLSKLSLNNYVATRNIAELIHNLKQAPHMARAYGSEIDKMLSDVAQAQIILNKYLETLKQ